MVVTAWAFIARTAKGRWCFYRPGKMVERLDWK
jgi:hypothetical protein